jgi:hypothetical protein
MRFRLYFVLLLLGSVASLAQTQSAASSRGVTGDVQDTSGAVIVGAQVTLTTQDARIVTH